MAPPYEGDSTTQQVPGITGKNTAGGLGVLGVSNNYRGVEGDSTNEHGVFGQSTNAAGVGGISTNYRGVEGVSTKEHGVFGQSTDAAGVGGASVNGRGVEGLSTNEHGVFGQSTSGAGVAGLSQNYEGVHGETNSPTSAAVTGIVLNPIGTGAGVYGESRGKGPAGYFKGNVTVTGDIFLSGADCAEQFDIAGAQQLEPGTVVVIDQKGALRESREAYDKRVAGVVSGAGEYKSGIVLDKQPSRVDRAPVALVGKVYCKVDAQYAPIEVGDLLTTSATPGHAMKAEDPLKVFGSVIGKALCPLREGQGLIPMLIALQ